MNTRSAAFLVIFIVTAGSVFSQNGKDPGQDTYMLHQKLREMQESSSGKTYGNEVVFAEPPHFRVLSKDSINGKPAFDYFLQVKAKLNGAYDIAGGMYEETFNVAKINVWDCEDQQRFWMDMHQSQVRLRGQHETKGGTLIGYLEGDFWGGSKHFRLRHLWVDYKFIHFGQDWSFFGDKEIWPNVFDWDGPSSGIWRREPELKFYYENESRLRYEIGVAQPGPQIHFAPEAEPNLGEAKQPIPDVIGAINKKLNFGHLRATGIYRNLQYADAGSFKAVPGYGASLSGYIRTNDESENPLQFQAVAGEGIATYLVSFSYEGLDYDAAPDGEGSLHAIPVMGAWASYEHWFSQSWHANLVLGYSALNSHEISAFTIPGAEYATKNTSIDLSIRYVLVNLMFDPVPDLILGIEYNVGSRTEKYSGSIETAQGEVNKLDKSRMAHRISFGAFFNF